MTRRQDSLGFGVQLPATTARIVTAAGEIAARPPEDPAFTHALMAHVSLPRRRTDAREFVRSSGRASLRLEAGSVWDGRQWQPQELPFGVPPRLTLLHVCDQAVRTRSRTVELGASVRQFLRGLELDTSGRYYARFRSQVRALAATRFLFGWADDATATTMQVTPFAKFEAWLDLRGQQRTLWPAGIELTSEFYESVCQHALPLDPRAIAALTHSSLALDVYVWIAHRLPRVTKRTGDRISWGALEQQFGAHSDRRDFRRTFLHALMQARSVYAGARIEPVTGGLRLDPSPPAVPRSRVQVIRTSG